MNTVVTLWWLGTVGESFWHGLIIMPLHRKRLPTFPTSSQWISLLYRIKYSTQVYRLYNTSLKTLVNIFFTVISFYTSITAFPNNKCQTHGNARSHIALLVIFQEKGRVYLASKLLCLFLMKLVSQFHFF